MLADSLARLGAGRSVLADRHGRVIAGNKTVDAARALGLGIRPVHTDGTELVVVIRDNLDLDLDASAREMAIADNRVAEVDLVWSAAALAALDATPDVDLSRFFTPGELRRALGPALPPSAEDPGTYLDAAEALAARWQTAPGQLWTIPSLSLPTAAHRLAIGDATDPAAVGRLFGHTSADLLFTDPPYGVAYVGKTGDALTLANDRLGHDGTYSLLRHFVAALPLKPGGAFYVCSPAGDMETVFRVALADAGLELHQSLVWVKHHFVMGRQDYHWRHETLLYGWRPGAAHYFIDDRTQDTIAQDDEPNPESLAKPALVALVLAMRQRERATVWREDRPSASPLHPTVKPLGLAIRAIENSTLPGQLVYDGFVGSGTTLVAAEQTGRVGYAMDLDPKYAAVTLQRLADLGLEPRRP